MSSSHAYDIAPALPLAPLPIHSEDEIESPEVLARFTCAICQEVGIEEYPDASSFEDITGKRLPDALFAPGGPWVCSQACLSQLMFQGASEAEKAALKRYELALRELREVAPDVKDVLKAWSCYAEIKPLSLEMAQTALGIVERRWGKDESSPAWIEANVAPEEALREAIGKALHILDWNAMSHVRMVIDFNSLFLNRPADSPYSKAYKDGGAGCGQVTSQFAAIALGSLGRIITTLKAALAGEVGE